MYGDEGEEKEDKGEEEVQKRLSWLIFPLIVFVQCIPYG